MIVKCILKTDQCLFVFWETFYINALDLRSLIQGSHQDNKIKFHDISDIPGRFSKIPDGVSSV